MDSIIIIRVLGDNFIYLYEYEEGSALAVDPGDSWAVLQQVESRGLRLKRVFCTHHHWDHVGGVIELKKKTGCEVIGGDRQRVPGIDRVVGDGEVLTLGSVNIRAIATPGHTRTSFCYYMASWGAGKAGVVWTGDTLFTGGCGRLLECDAESMRASLHKLSCLPEDTLVYPGHDYTIENYEFALSIEPDNEAIRERVQQVRLTQEAGEQPVGSTIGEEKKTNLFLRADAAELKSALGMRGARAAEVFAELRRRKDAF